MDPQQLHLDHDGHTRVEEVLCNVWQDSVPVEIWRNGVKVAVAIHPEEFDLLERLVREGCAQ